MVEFSTEHGKALKGFNSLKGFPEKADKQKWKGI